jgi:hypothetical protein
LGGDLSVLNSNALKASDGLPIYRSPASALITPAGVDVLQAKPALTNAIYVSQSLNGSSLIDSDVLKASDGLPIYRSPASTLITPAGVDVLQANPALTNAIYVSQSLNGSLLIDSDALQASEGLSGDGLLTTALNGPVGLDVLRANPAWTNSIYAPPSVKVSLLLNSDALQTSEGLSGDGSLTASSIKSAALDASFTGDLINQNLISSSIGALLLPTDDGLNANGALLRSSVPTNYLYDFMGLNSLRYGESTEYPLLPVATPLQDLARECALCSGVKL